MLDTFGPKPDAPDESARVQTDRHVDHRRSLHRAVAWRAAKWMHRIGLVHGMNHTHNDHGRGSYWMFTGSPYLRLGERRQRDEPGRPAGTSLVRGQAGAGQGADVSPFVIVPHRMDVAGGRRAPASSPARWAASHDPRLTGGNPNDERLQARPPAAGPQRFGRCV